MIWWIKKKECNSVRKKIEKSDAKSTFSLGMFCAKKHISFGKN